MHQRSIPKLLAVMAGLLLGAAVQQTETLPPAVDVAAAQAASEVEMQSYTEQVAGSGIAFDMVAVPSGQLSRRPDESIAIQALWMSRLEVTWDLYRQFMLQLDLERSREDVPQDAFADAVSRPTPPYVPMDFGMGTEGMPAISMTQFAARHFTRWLSYRTGRFYRLPTEAEWEYACRAGAAPTDDAPTEGWSRENSERSYHPGGAWPANAWGLHDMLGNVAEWTLDAYGPFPETPPPGSEPVWPQDVYSRSLRGGAFTDPTEKLDCATRRGSSEAWKARDPQIPQSIWYLTNARFAGLRVVRPLHPPPPETWTRYWDADDAETAEILAEQRAAAGLDE
ncbi:MAG: SUMF1/EgtB/PvdO family nonheme iron enzyme [Acidobacteriota bacterium]